MGRWNGRQENGEYLLTVSQDWTLHNFGTFERVWIPRLAAAHNADCNAYEQRIAELTAELARVKAESLRVVKCADDMPPLNLDTLVRHIHIDGHVVRLERWDRPC